MIRRSTFGKLGNRGGTRIALGVAGLLDLPQRTHGCTIIDASRSGARLRVVRMPVAAPPRVGTPAILRFFEGEMMGAIVWSTADQCAIGFDRPLPPHDFARLRWIADNPAEFAQAQLGSASALWR